MNAIYHDIYKAVHEGKWLSIEYKNSSDEVTKYWIGIMDINPINRCMKVQGLHLGLYTIKELYIHMDSILCSYVIEASYFDRNKELIDDIDNNPSKYRKIFDNAVNLKILDYLVDCNKLDSVPYTAEYSLINLFDGDWRGEYKLSNDQFCQIVRSFQRDAKAGESVKKIRQLAINVMSINMPKGLYVLAYRKLRLDVKAHTLRQEDITICMEFALEHNKAEGKLSIRKFLDADDLTLLDDFENNQELIKDKITRANPQINGIDDMPYIIAIGRNVLVDLNYEYEGINEMYSSGEITVPVRAFFGELLKQADRRKNYPITLLDRKINLDQLLAIHNAMKYPLAYIQGPPGTGKTNTIVNTIVTAFFNEKTVLFTSYNNHPIDGVCEKLKNIQYSKKGIIPFPIIRLGNDQCVLQALNNIKQLYEQTKDITIFDGTLEKNKDDKTRRTQKLTELLERHEEKIDLKEREETILKMMSLNNHLTFQTELQGVQLANVRERLAAIGEITDEEALELVAEDEELFKKYLYYISAKYIKRLQEPKNKDLMDIVNCQDDVKRVKQFNTYIRKEENLKKFQRIFPVIATTAISAHKLGTPRPYFDMVIMDEASQGNVAVSLVPIIRGKSLMLVGDPQQLSPVILLNRTDNERLKEIYGITQEYDYIKNSIYKTYLACDAVSEEILLSHHYRCSKKIISFNNKKYYNNKLIIKSRENSDKPLIFKNVSDDMVNYKNTAQKEAVEIVDFILSNPDKSIGVITPFANQKDCINKMMKENGISNVPCGTVHAFQGDEKEVILFSLALTKQTGRGTYDWLKNNKELINVATSRAKEQLVILSDINQIKRLHTTGDDDIYELIEYVQSNGESQVTTRETSSRALGIKPYSTQTEAAFLTTLTHALDNVLNTGNRCVVQKEVSIAHVFEDNKSYDDLFYTGRFDFVVYEKGYKGQDMPLFAIELDGKEHYDNETVMRRDREKNNICREHGFELIRVENSYARRYNYIKNILIDYFKKIK